MTIAERAEMRAAVAMFKEAAPRLAAIEARLAALEAQRAADDAAKKARVERMRGARKAKA